MKPQLTSVEWGEVKDLLEKAKAKQNQHSANESPEQEGEWAEIFVGLGFVTGLIIRAYDLPTEIVVETHPPNPQPISNDEIPF